MKTKCRWRKKTGFLLMAALLLAGCGKAATNESIAYETAAKTADSDTSYSGYATDDIYMMEEVKEEEMETGGEGVEIPEVQDLTRKLIKNVSMSVETESFDVLLKTITEKTEGLGGYVEASNTYNGSYYYGDSCRSASLTLRIPSEKLNTFLSAVSENSNVISRDETVTDVTLQYVDIKSRRESLETEHERLLELMEQAETVEDIITIESRLSEVRYEMESMEAQLRTLDNQVSYSTVYLYIEEVVKYTPVKEQGTWEKITTGFTESLYEVGNGIRNFIIGLIIHIPYLVIWAVILAVSVFLIRKVRGGSEKRKQKKEAKEAAKAEKKKEEGKI